ncbi:MAG: hypothetical protein QOJ42_7086, partial [Acidobacteriaceae bacterium]|nr:hypothetical protein [Acidobacteriaceae bacterium]
MSKVVIEMTMSLDGFVAGPEDGKANPLGKHGGMHIFDWYFYGTEEYRDPRFLPEPGTNREEVERLFADSGAFIFGRRTCEITNGWGGRYPVGGAPVFVLTQPAEGVSQWPVATDLRHRGIASAIRQSQEVAGGKNIKLGGASPGKQALAAGLCDEIVVHLAPYLLGGGVRLFDEMKKGTR